MLSLKLKTSYSGVTKPYPQDGKGSEKSRFKSEPKIFAFYIDADEILRSAQRLTHLVSRRRLGAAAVFTLLAMATAIAHPTTTSGSCLQRAPQSGSGLGELGDIDTRLRELL